MKTLRTIIITTAVVLLAVAIIDFFSSDCDGETDYWKNFASHLQEDNEKLESQLSQANKKSQPSVSQEKNKKIEELEEQLSDSNKKIEELSEENKKLKLVSSTGKKFKKINANLRLLLFWESDVHYQMNDETFTFYSDFACHSAITDKLTFVNYFDYEIVDPNDENNHVFISMSVEKGLVYSKTRPYFDPVK